MPRHIINLLVLLASVLLVALAGKAYFTDSSFYRFGHYRADAVPELAAGEPLFRGAAYCVDCHAERQAAATLGAHRTVQCEVCHGADREHPDGGSIQVPADTIRLCSTCHEAMPARPARQPQIVLGEHPFPGEETPPCQSCHDPHSPGDMEPDAGTPTGPALTATAGAAGAGVPAAASKCANCHGASGEGVKQNPALAGLESAVFIERMNEYRSGAREHKLMAKMANSLSDAEIAELAGYYEGLAAIAPE
jgi:cytochrome c553